MGASLSGIFLASARMTAARVMHEVIPCGIPHVAPITRPIAWLNPVPTDSAPAYDIHAANWQASLELKSEASSLDRLRFWNNSLIAWSASASIYGWCLSDATASIA